MHSEFNAGVGQYTDIVKLVRVHTPWILGDSVNISKMQANSDESEVLAEITAMINGWPS